VIDILFLFGLPASGKSEIRRYLAALDPQRRAADLRLGTPVHLDDYPYVYLMRLISRELRRLHSHPVFFATDADPLLEAADWLTLTGLVDEDYAGLHRPEQPIQQPAAHLLARFDRARAAAGLPAPFGELPPDTRAQLESAIEGEAAALLHSLAESRPVSLEGHTVVIEMSRGAGEGMRPPFPRPWGYAHSLATFSPEILARAAALYVWVTPTESRRRNLERALPGADGSILYHGVPEQVLYHDYAGDDIAWLLDHADRSAHITLAVDGRRCQIPTVRFDNRVDRTSFLRADPASWPPRRVADLHQRLTAAFTALLRR
jgi:hypothetical protein